MFLVAALLGLVLAVGASARSGAVSGRSNSGPYSVMILTNVASPGNIFVGLILDVKGKFTCNFTDGGLCAGSGGSNVAVTYTTPIGTFSSCSEALAAYTAHTMGQHEAFGGQKIYFDTTPIPRGLLTPPSTAVSYFVDNIENQVGPSWCTGGAAPTTSTPTTTGAGSTTTKPTTSSIPATTTAGSTPTPSGLADSADFGHLLQALGQINVESLDAATKPFATEVNDFFSSTQNVCAGAVRQIDVATCVGKLLKLHMDMEAIHASPAAEAVELLALTSNLGTAEASSLAAKYPTLRMIAPIIMRMEINARAASATEASNIRAAESRLIALSAQYDGASS